VRGNRSERILERLWRARQRDTGGGDGGREPGADGGTAAGEDSCALDWRQIQEQLDPVGRRWDLAILCNLSAAAGRRPADLLSAINDQAGPGRQLSPQVQSGRLHALEDGGYVRHEDLTVIPLNRVYYLEPRGQQLIADLAGIAGLGRA